MNLFTKRLVLLLILSSALFQDALYAQSVMLPTDPTISYFNGPSDPRPLPAPPALPANANVISPWVRGRVKLMTSSAGGGTSERFNADAYKPYIYKYQTFRLKYPRTYNPTANDGKRYPMMVFLHGLGEMTINAVPGTGATKTANMPYYIFLDNEWQLRWGGRLFLNAVNSTAATGYDGYILYMQVQQYGWDNAHFTAIKEICDYMVANNKLDPFAITDNGLSGGGLATWALMTNHPTMISGAIPMSGASTGCLPEIDKFKFTPVWLFQGGGDATQDEQVSVQVVNGINAAGGRITYRFVPGVGHNTWSTAFADPDFLPFIKRSYAANPWTLYGKTSFVTGETIAVTVGVAPGFDSYEWRRNGVVIPGATANTIFVNRAGKYEVRLTKLGVTSEWSRIPVNIFMNGSLPVNWKSFSGNLVTGGVGLNWEVENNEQGKYYQVEHSTDGKNYVKVDQIANSPSVKAYSYNYKTSESGVHYFRILQVDADGKFVYSKVVVINIKGDASYTIRLISNPVRTDYADLEINAVKQGRALIEIWSASGAKISSRQQQVASGNTRLQVPLNGAAAGLYLVKVQIGNAEVTEKLLKF